MALPTNANVGWVTGTFMDNTGALCSGTVTFTASTQTILDPDSTPPVTILPRPIVVALSGGSLLTSLIATDDPDLEPLGFTYNASFDLTAAGQKVARDPFNFFVPTGPSNLAVDLTTVVHVDPNSGQVIDIDIDVLATSEAYTNVALATHVADPDPHPGYMEFVDVNGTPIDQGVILTRPGDPLPANAPAGRLLIFGGLGG